MVGLGPRRARGLTLMDLIGLTAGIALLLSIRQTPPPSGALSPGRPTVLGWVRLIVSVLHQLPGPARGASAGFAYHVAWIDWFIDRAVAATAIVLTPVILGRRAQDGAPTRPAEWFVIVVGALQLADGLGYLRETFYWRLLARFDGAVAVGPLLVAISPEGIAAVVALATFVGAVGLRRALPAWALASALVSILVLLFWGPASGLGWELKYRVSAALDYDSGPMARVLRVVGPGLAALPATLLLALPAVAMLRDWRRAGHRGRRRLEWAGLVLLIVVVSTWIFDLAAEVARPPAWRATNGALLLYSIAPRAWLAPTVLLAWYFVRRFGADFDTLMRPIHRDTPGECGARRG